MPAEIKTNRPPNARPPSTRRPTIASYSMAVVSVMVMAMLRLLLGRWLEDQSRFILFLPAVMLTAWYGGLGPALVALGLGAGAGAFFLLPSQFGLRLPMVTDLLELSLYLMAGLMIALVTEQQRRTQLHLEQANHQLVLRQTEIETLNDQLQRAMTETYHRVKNNLNVVAALIAMQLLEDRETVPASELRRIEQHIRILAIINDLLTQQTRQQGQVTQLSSEAALEKLLTIIPETLGDRRLHSKIESIPLSVKQGTALAVLVNELVSNAVKHGTGDIDVSLAVSGSMARLEVDNEGPGFPAGFNALLAAHTGLELVESICRLDLGGTVTYANRPEGGAQVVVTFPMTSVNGEDADKSTDRQVHLQ